MLTRSAAFALILTFSAVISQAQNTKVNFVTPLDNIGVPNNATLSVYPNPAADEAKLAFNSATNNDRYEVRIINNSGMQLQEIEGTTVQGQNTLRIHVGQYAAGVYFVQLITQSGTRETLKLLKQPISS